MIYQEEGESKFFEYIKIPYPYQRPEPNFHADPNPDKILVLSDPHEPYGNEVVFQRALEVEHDAGMVIVPGDLGDYYSKSRFKKTKHKAFTDELRAVFLRIEWLSVHWQSVKIMLGNHDDRPEKKIGQLFSGEEELPIMTEQNLLKRFASYFPNVEIVGQQLDGSPKILTHIYQHGDIIFTHGELSRVQKTAAMEYISKYLRRWGKLIGLQPYRIIAQGHNHQDMKTSDGSEKWFMLPTSCDPLSDGMEYIFQPRMIGHPPAVGYSVFNQHEGVTNYQLSNNWIIDDYA